MQKYSLLRCLFLLTVAETTGPVESMLRARYLEHLPSPFLVMSVMWVLSAHPFKGDETQTQRG